MNKRIFTRFLAGAMALFLLNGCSMGSAMSLFDQLGGMGQMSKLTGNMLGSLVKNPSMAGLLGNIDMTGATGQVSDQLCAALGGGCSAPFSADQIASAANKLNPTQQQAISDSFGSALSSVTDSPELQKAINKSVGSQLGGIVGALL
jgi:hypothetical protein